MEQIAPQVTGHYKVGFHQTPLLTSWLFLGNLTIIVATLKWSKYSFYLHTIIGILMIGLTLAGTLHVLFEIGIWYNPTKRFQTIHNIGGLIVVILLAVQGITGALSRLVSLSANIRPKLCRWTKMVHRFSSYSIMALAKFQYMIIAYRRKKYDDIFMFLVWDFLCIAIYLWIKFRYWTLSETIIESQMVSDKEQIQAYSFMNLIRIKINQIQNKFTSKEFNIPILKYIPTVYQSQREIPISNYCLFNDFVYRLDPIEERHPGGKKIIQLIKGKQINRYLYGCYPLQTIPDWVSHKHTQNSLKMCGQPIGRIQRDCPMKGFPEYSKVKFESSDKIHVNSSLRAVYLQPTAELSENWTHLQYQGFTHEEQFGQHFTLTICDENRNKFTRLFTAVWALRPDNIDLMNPYFPQLITVNNFSTKNPEILVSDKIKSQYQEVIPLLVKKYEDGQVTPKIFGKDSKIEMILSKPIGSGLEFESLPSQGKVIMICGGTGLLPFVDLIDLLFKRVKYLESFNLAENLATNDPLVKEDIFKDRQFVLYFACQSIHDVHPLTMCQINALIHSRFIRIKNIDLNQVSHRYQNVSFQQSYFNEQIQQEFQSRHSISRVYICGPPKMNLEILKLLQDSQLPSHLYHFV